MASSRSTSSELSSPPASPPTSQSSLDNDTQNLFDAVDGGPIPWTRTQRRLEEFVDLLESWNWNFTTFIQAWIGYRNDDEDKATIRGFGGPSNRRKHLRHALRHRRVQHRVVDEDISSNKLMHELDLLVYEKYFNKFNLDDLDSIDRLDFSEAFPIMKRSAPTWSRLLERALSNSRRDLSSYVIPKRQNERVDRTLYTILAMICHSRNPKKSNVFTKHLDCYFASSGVKRRVIETLQGMGICSSYSQGNELMNKLADKAEASTTQQGGDLPTCG